MTFIVTEKAERPAGPKGQCFYCGRAVGAAHDESGCVLVQKKVKVRMTVEYEIEVPAHWAQMDVEFHRNEGSWCADNALRELERLSEEQGCLCPIVQYEYLGGDTAPHLRE